jgi:hypothetical protein
VTVLPGNLKGHDDVALRVGGLLVDHGVEAELVTWPHGPATHLCDDSGDAVPLSDRFLRVIVYSGSSEPLGCVDDCHGIVIGSDASSSIAHVALSGKSLKAISGSLKLSGALELVGKFSLKVGESRPSKSVSLRVANLCTTSLVEIV